MKKLCTALFLVLLSICIFAPAQADMTLEEVKALAPCSCAPHNDYTTVIGNPATCFGGGYETFKLCNVCGGAMGTITYQPAGRHEPITIAGKAATCLEDGYTESTECLWCDLVYTPSEVIPALGHNIQVYPGNAPTCVDEGMTDAWYCPRCGAEEMWQTIPALGHDQVVDAAVAATCTQTGLTEGWHCSRCTEKVAQTEAPALGHDQVVDAAVAATCTQTGLTEGWHCTRCNEKVAQTVTPALGHDIVVDAAVAATCTQTGLTEGWHCTRCNEKVAQTATPALGHDIVIDAAVAATCTQTGLTEGWHCSRCKEKAAQTETPAIGHDIVIDAAVRETCEETGLTEGWHCTRCAEKKAQIEIPAHGHDYYPFSIEPTCTSKGVENGERCLICLDIRNGTVHAALGHEWGEWVPMYSTTSDRHVRECNRNSKHREEKACVFKLGQCVDCGRLYDVKLTGSGGGVVDGAVWLVENVEPGVDVCSVDTTLPVGSEVHVTLPDYSDQTAVYLLDDGEAEELPEFKSYFPEGTIIMKVVAGKLYAEPDTASEVVYPLFTGPAMVIEENGNGWTCVYVAGKVKAWVMNDALQTGEIEDDSLYWFARSFYAGITDDDVSDWLRDAERRGFESSSALTMLTERLGYSEEEAGLWLDQWLKSAEMLAGIRAENAEIAKQRQERENQQAQKLFADGHTPLITLTSDSDGTNTVDMVWEAGNVAYSPSGVCAAMYSGGLYAFIDPVKMPDARDAGAWSEGYVSYAADAGIVCLSPNTEGASWASENGLIMGYRAYDMDSFGYVMERIKTYGNVDYTFGKKRPMTRTEEWGMRLKDVERIRVGVTFEYLD